MADLGSREMSCEERQRTIRSLKTLREKIQRKEERLRKRQEHWGREEENMQKLNDRLLHALEETEAHRAEFITLKTQYDALLDEELLLNQQIRKLEIQERATMRYEKFDFLDQEDDCLQSLLHYNKQESRKKKLICEQ